MDEYDFHVMRLRSAIFQSMLRLTEAKFGPFSVYPTQPSKSAGLTVIYLLVVHFSVILRELVWAFLCE